MKKVVFPLIPLIALILVSGCVQDSPNDGGTTNGDQTGGEVQTYTMAQVAEHDTASDCWTVIHGKVYDLTTFMASHPGGAAINTDCGIDSSELYETRPMGSGTPHSDNARSLLDNFYIGDLEE